MFDSSLFYYIIDRVFYTPFLLGYLSGMITQDLIMTPAQVLQRQTTDTPSFISLEDVKQFLQINYYLPPNYTNTTFGAIAVADSIRSGNSRILKTIMQQSNIQEKLASYASSCTVNDTTVTAGMEQAKNAPMNIYENIENTNTLQTLIQLDRTYHFKLHFLHPVFSLLGWNDVISQLVYSPDLILRKAYEEIREEEGDEEIREHFKFIHNYNIFQKQLFLHNFSLEQIFYEVDIIRLFIKEFYNYFTEDYSVADWVQGLIDVLIR